MFLQNIWFSVTPFVVSIKAFGLNQCYVLTEPVFVEIKQNHRLPYSTTSLTLSVKQVFRHTTDFGKTKWSTRHLHLRLHAPLED